MSSHHTTTALISQHRASASVCAGVAAVTGGVHVITPASTALHTALPHTLSGVRWMDAQQPPMTHAHHSVMAAQLNVADGGAALARMTR